MSCLVASENPTESYMIAAVHVYSVSHPWARTILTQDTFELKFIYILWIDLFKFYSIWREHTWRLSGNHVLCMVNFFPIRIKRRSAVTAMQQSSMSRSIFCFFGSFASDLSRHFAYRAVVANMGLQPPLFALKRHGRGCAMVWL